MSNKKFLTMHVDMDAFTPATEEEKSYIVQMRESTTFFKDGMRRFLKNPVATVSLVLIVIITLSAILIPMFWPYTYDQQLGVTLGGSVDPTYIHLGPMKYGATEGQKLLGLASAQVHFVPSAVKQVYMNPAQKAGDVEKDNETKAQLEELYNSFLAGDRSQESFAALADSLPRDATYDEYEGIDTTVFSKERKIAQWLWEANWRGKGVRQAGDTALIVGKSGFFIVRHAGYQGETSFVFPHLFGTDGHGRDYFIRVVYGARVSLAVGFFASLIVLVIGMLMGSVAGYCGGRVDTVIMRLVDIIYSLPDMLMVILLSAMLGSRLETILAGTPLERLGANMISLFLVFALLYWVSMARQIRGQILSLKEQEYVLASRATGAKGKWIIAKHLIPNSISVVIISTALQIPSAIFTESYLSFLGLGINAPMTSLGSLASDALDGYRSYPYTLVIPALVIGVIVLSLNLLGDGLRDAFDPKLKS